MKSEQLQHQLIASEMKLKLKEEELLEAKKEIDRSRAISVELAEPDQLKALNIQLQDQVSLHIKSTFIMSKRLVRRGRMLCEPKLDLQMINIK